MLTRARYLELSRSTMAVRPLGVLFLLMVCMSACRAQEDSPAAVWGQLREANRLLQSEKYDQAAELATKAGDKTKDDAEVQQQAAQILFLSGKVVESLPYFERANSLDDQLRPHNWQRGVALGCAGKFEEGADQFKIHHDVNPDDVENSAWYFLCLAKTKGRAAAEAAVIPSRGDARPPMMDVLKMLKGTLSPEELLATIEAKPAEVRGAKLAKFYGFLYVGLYYDSIGEEAKAIAALDRCLSVADSDYMGRTARHYRTLRFPASKSGSSAVKEDSSK